MEHVRSTKVTTVSVPSPAAAHSSVVDSHLHTCHKQHVLATVQTCLLNIILATCKLITKTRHQSPETAQSTCINVVVATYLAAFDV